MKKLTTMVMAACLAMAAGGVLAQDAMKKDAMAKKDTMSKDAMSKKDAMGKQDAMKKDAMSHDAHKAADKAGAMGKMEKKDGMTKK